MFQEGKIKTYNEDRGFGFIQIEGQSKDFFFHVKDFPNKNIPPRIGEKLKFLIVEDNGKFKADHIVRLDVKVEIKRHTPQSRAANTIQRKSVSGREYKEKKTKGFNFINFLVGLVILTIFGAIFIPFISGIYQRETLKMQAAEVTNTSQLVNNPKTNHADLYSCDGRKHCSEMRSYEEAVFFINHCPGTMMDGDHDGEPCEGQFKNRW